MDAQKLKNLVNNLVLTPSIYIALVMGAIIGGIFGSISGAIAGYISGVIISEPVKMLITIPTTILGHEISQNYLNLLLDTLIGSSLGLILGGLGIGAITALCVYFNKKFPHHLTDESMTSVLIFSGVVAALSGICMLICSVTGGELHRILGPTIGAFAGWLLALIGAIVWISKLQK